MDTRAEPGLRKLGALADNYVQLEEFDRGVLVGISETLLLKKKAKAEKEKREKAEQDLKRKKGEEQ